MLPARQCLTWYTLRTKPRQEARAAINLKQLGIETLAPTVREPHARRRGDAALMLVVPLFPGYLFARFTLSQHTAVRHTRGVHDIVSFGDGGTPVDDSIIAMIQRRVGPEGFVRLDTPGPGDAVELVGGPFHSLHGIFERTLHAHDRVIVLLSGLGAAARIQYSAAFVRKLPLAAGSSEKQRE